MDLKNDKNNVPVLTSNYISKINKDFCSSCGICEKFCPINAITTKKVEDPKDKKKFKLIYEVDQDMCLGCGVCETKCEGLNKTKAISMSYRGQRLFIPKDFLGRTITMGIERKRLQNFLFSDVDSRFHKLMRKVTKAVLTFKPIDMVMNSPRIKQQTISNFLRNYSPMGQWKV